MRIIGHDGYIGSTLDLPDVDAVLLLAAHSSIRMCQNDPDGAWVNNVDYFRAVLGSIKPDQKFIYASSATIYDGVKNPAEDTDEFHLKHLYDLTKRTIDNLAQLSDKKYYGLRFATVNGWSPNLRVDIMLNKMVYDARTTGRINIKNPQIERPVLGINDCQRAIKHILENDLEPGIYNLASFTASVQEMADYVAKEFGATIVDEESEVFNRPYAYGIDTTKFEATGFKFKDTLESIVKSLHTPLERIKTCE